MNVGAGKNNICGACGASLCSAESEAGRFTSLALTHRGRDKIKYPAFELERDLSSNNDDRNPAGFDQLNTFDLVNKTLLTKSFSSTKMK